MADQEQQNLKDSVEEDSLVFPIFGETMNEATQEDPEQEKREEAEGGSGENTARMEEQLEPLASKVAELLVPKVEELLVQKFEAWDQACALREQGNVARQEACAEKLGVLQAKQEGCIGKQQECTAAVQSVMRRVGELKNDVQAKDGYWKKDIQEPLLDLLFGCYRELYKALADAEQAPEMALKNLKWCLQWLEDEFSNEGMYPYVLKEGDAFETGKCRLVERIATGNQGLDRKVAKMIRPGFLDEQGNLKTEHSKAWVNVYRFDSSLAPQVEQVEQEETASAEETPEEGK